MNCPGCKTKMKLLSAIYSWKDGKPTFCLEDYECPNCKARIGTRVRIETYREGGTN